MNTVTSKTIRTFLLAATVLVSTAASGQLRIGAVAGTALNIPVYKSDDGNQSPDLYGKAVGGYAGFRLQYDFTPRFSLAGEACYQVLPYTVKYLTGQLYPGYATLSVLPAYAVSPKVHVEAGIGSGFTVVSRFGDKVNNDPLLLTTLGLRFPLGRWGLSVRYYDFLRPVNRETTDRGTTTVSNRGVQVGVTYDLFRR